MSTEEPKQHYLPRLYLKRFTSNPNVKNKSNQKILSLDHNQTIREHYIKNVCAMPHYNTNRQDKKLQRLEKTVLERSSAWASLVGDELAARLNAVADELRVTSSALRWRLVALGKLKPGVARSLPRGCLAQQRARSR